MTSTSVAFAVVYTAIVGVNDYPQLFVVRLNLRSGAPEGLEPLAMANRHSFFLALEVIGYGFSGRTLIAASPIFTTSMNNPGVTYPVT